MKTSKFIQMLLIACISVACLSSCGKDSDNDVIEGGTTDDWDDHEDIENGDLSDIIVGYWTNSNENGDIISETAVRFTSDGRISYEHFEESYDSEVEVFAFGRYRLKGDMVLAEYDDVFVDAPGGEDNYDGFTDGRPFVETYEVESSNQGKRLILIGENTTDITLTRYNSWNIFPVILSGEWSASNEDSYSYNETEMYSFTGNGSVAYEYSNNVDDDINEIRAEGSYTVTEDMRIVFEYDDVDVYKSNGETSLNGFIDGRREVREYDVFALFYLEHGCFFLYDSDGNTIEFDRR